MHVFLFNFFNVNVNKKETNAHTINQSLTRRNTLRQFYFEGKEYFYDTYFRAKINRLYSNFDYRTIMTTKTFNKH